MVFAISGSSIDLQYFLDRLSAAELVANQTRLVFDTAKARHQQQPDTIGRGGRDHVRPAGRSQGCKPLDAADKIRADVDEVGGLLVSRWIAGPPVAGRDAEFLVQVAYHEQGSKQARLSHINSMSEDRIFAEEKFGNEPFRFDETVARVFPDMLRRSVPGYAATLEAIGSLASRFVQAGTCCYDLGCSLGAATLAMRQGIRAPDCHIVAVDNAPAMIERCERLIAEDDAACAGRPPVDLRLEDLRDTKVRDASLVVMNYTLQFVAPAGRDALVRKIFDGLVPGGLLFLSEKVVDEEPAMESLLVDLYHEYKRRNDYSALEIARKRAALDKVLVPESVPAHRRRLAAAGFANVAVWLRYFNFVSMIAIKAGPGT